MPKRKKEEELRAVKEELNSEELTQEELMNDVLMKMEELPQEELNEEEEQAAGSEADSAGAEPWAAKDELNDVLMKMEVLMKKEEPCEADPGGGAHEEEGADSAGAESCAAKKEEEEASEDPGDETEQEEEASEDPGAAKEEHRCEVDVAEPFPWREGREGRRPTAVKSGSAAAPLPDHVDDRPLHNPPAPKTSLPPWRHLDHNSSPPPKTGVPPWRDLDRNPVPIPKTSVPPKTGPPPKTSVPPWRPLDRNPVPPPLPPRQALGHAADPVPPPKARYWQPSSRGRRKTTKEICQYWGICCYYREQLVCFYCAVHCRDGSCRVHWNKPGSCQSTWCCKPAPFTVHCIQGMCRDHCTVPDQCSPHSKAATPGQSHARTTCLCQGWQGPCALP